MTDSTTQKIAYHETFVCKASPENSKEKVEKIFATYTKGQSLISPVSKELLKLENILIQKWVKL